ncbi:MAG: hypothetical protein RIS26_207 [Actinomycetota bacterium]
MKKMGISLVAITSLIAGIFSVTPVAAAELTCTQTVTTSGITVQGSNNGDVICLNANNVTLNALSGNDTVIDNGTGNIIYLGDGDDTYDGTDGSGSDVNGGNGDDTLTGTPGADDLAGDAGNDEIIGGDGVDLITGGAGDDTLYGNAGNDKITGDADTDVIFGGDDSDFIDAGAGDDTVIGGNPDGTVGHDGEDTIRGGDGDDDLSGNAGKDNIFGEVGTDTINGNEGDDVLAGGPGIDRVAALADFELNLCDYTNQEVRRTETCIYDDTAPTLDDFTWDKSSYEVGADDAVANLTITASDDQGVGYMQVYCYGNDSNTWPVSLYLQANNVGTWSVSGTGNPSKVSQVGNAKSIKLTIRMDIAYGTKPGSYQCSLQVRDLLDHYAYINATALAITRANGNFDDEAPVLSNFAWDETSYEVSADVAHPRASFKLSDTTGVANFWTNCYGNGTNASPISLSGYWDSTAKTWRVSSIRDASVITNSTNNTEVNLNIELTVRQGFKPGSYTCYMYANDTRNHSKYHDLPSLVITRADGIYDDNAPAVSEFSWDAETYDAGASAVAVRSSLTVSDATAISYFQVWCQGTYPNPNPISYTVYGSGSNWNVYGTGSPFIVSKTGDDKQLTLTVESQLAFGTYPGNLPCYFYSRDTLEQTDQVSISAIKIARTPAGMPSAPSNVTFTPTEGKPNEGLLSWTAPTDLGSPALKDYQIDFSRDGISWKTIYKKNGKITDTQYYIDGGLVAATDYWFRVRGENGGGFIEGSLGAAWSVPLHTRTLDAARPLAPSNIVARNVTKTGVSLSWTAPTFNGGSPITNFVVETSRNDGATWTRLTDEQKPVSTSVNFTMNGLAPGTHYLVRVAAVNLAGESDWTELVGGLTTLTSSATKPLGLTASRIDTTTLSLSWNLPDSNGGLPITDYRVEVSGNGGTTWTAVPHAASNLRGFSLDKLSKGKTYKFRVAAVTSLGVGAFSDVLQVTTLVSTPSAPTALVIKNASNGAFSVSWKAPADNGGAAIYDYTLEVARDGSDNWIEVESVESLVKAYTVRGMAPGTAYQVRVSAVNAAGYSEYVTGTFTTVKTVASAPQDLEVGNVTPNGALLSWTLPESNGGDNLSDYKVEVSSNCKVFTAIKHTASIATSFAVNNLAAGTRYCFRVSAKNGIGYGAVSNVIEVVTFGNVPGVPSALRVTARSKTSIGLGWTKPTVIDGSAVRNYIVTYSKDLGETWTTVRKSVSTSTSLTVTGLQSATTYWFKVTAVNDVGQSQEQENPLVVVTK